MTGVQTCALPIYTAPARSTWQAWREARQALEQARRAQDTLASERERLSWQIGELDKLAPNAGEWEELNTQHGRLSNAQALIDAAQQACGLLEGDDAPNRAAIEKKINDARGKLR